MTDEEALQELLRDSDGPCVLWMREGFAAGLRHARQWRELTSDPASWPAEGQEVLLYGPGDGIAMQHWFDRQQPYWTHWLPLPEAP